MSSLAPNLFQPGNNAASIENRRKPITDTIKRIIAQDDAGLLGANRLRNGLEKVFDCAATGDLDAITFIRDTVQGKPAQAVTVSGDEDRPLITAIKMIVVQATNSNEINNLVAIQGSDETKKIIDATDSRESEAPPPTPAQVISPEGMGG